MKQRFRNKNWYDKFWKNKPKAFGNPNKDVVEMINYSIKYLKNEDFGRLRILDIACGNGRYLSVPVFKNFSLTGIDISEEACKLARKNLKKYKDVQIFCVNFLEMKTNIGLFDLVISSGLLEEINHKNQNLVIEKIKTLVNNEGFLILKYCLEIKNRGQQVEDDFVISRFSERYWKIIKFSEEKKMREYNNGVEGEDMLRTGILFVQKRLLL